MRDTEVLQHIKDICVKKGWSYYRLAKECQIPYSTISNMLNRTNIPSIPTLQKICDGLEISLADFFADGKSPMQLTESQKSLLDSWGALNRIDRKLVETYMKGLSKSV